MTEDQAERWDRSYMRRLTIRFGHRAVFIWLIAWAWIIMGVIVGIGDQPPIDHLFHTYLPTWVRVVLWVAPAAAAAAVARSRAEWLAFVLLGLPPAQRMASFWTGAGFNLYLTGNPHMFWELIGRGFVYFVILLVMWLVATWPNDLETDLDLSEADNIAVDGENVEQ